MNRQWEQRNSELWASIDALPEEEFLAAMDNLVGELPAGDPVAFFERAAALDSTGHTSRAVPLYEEALKGELPGERRRRAVIQMASSLRSLGHPEKTIELLTKEQAAGEDHLSDAISAVLALALTDVGREREAVAIAVTALAPHLPRYQRSMANYARLLVTPTDT